MTTRQSHAPQSPESPMYYVSFERLAELRRSPIVMLAARRGLSCPSRLRPDHELTEPQELIDEIAEYSVSEEGFIRSDMSIQEIVFRLLLSRRNQPTSLRDLHHELTERWATPVRPINITEEALGRILEADDYYGFARADNNTQEAPPA